MLLLIGKARLVHSPGAADVLLALQFPPGYGGEHGVP
jgi:hypothetical protein